MPRKKLQTPPEPPAIPQVPEWLLEESETLKEMIEWWKTRESAMMEGSVRRPVFAGKTRNTGIRMNAEVLDRAIHKSKQERFKTGGNLSQLVEWLMWIYIGSPTDVLDQPPPKRAD
jgi:hypothetical protein